MLDPTKDSDKAEILQESIRLIYQAKLKKLFNHDKTNKPLLEDSEARQQLFLEHNISDLPEINANMQHNIDTSREGLSFNVPLVDDALVLSEDEDLGHINRRAEEYDIDLDQDEV